MSDHSVGYGKPPRNTQFRKGQSGNPKGRRRGSKNLATVLLDSAHESVTVNEGGRRKSITKLEAMSKQLANKAAAGDPKATHLLTQLLQICEERSERSTPEAVIDESDEHVVQQLFVRIRELSQGIDDAAGNTG